MLLVGTMWCCCALCAGVRSYVASATNTDNTTCSPYSPLNKGCGVVESAVCMHTMAPSLATKVATLWCHVHDVVNVANVVVDVSSMHYVVQKVVQGTPSTTSCTCSPNTSHSMLTLYTG